MTRCAITAVLMGTAVLLAHVPTPALRVGDVARPIGSAGTVNAPDSEQPTRWCSWLVAEEKWRRTAKMKRSVTALGEDR